MVDLCRICMVPGGAIDIHNHLIDGKLLVNFLLEVASINREVSLQYKFICNNCCFSIGLFYDFQQKIINAEKVLTETYFKEVKTEYVEETDLVEQKPNNIDGNVGEQSLHNENKNNSNNITFFIHPSVSDTPNQDTPNQDTTNQDTPNQDTNTTHLDFFNTDKNNLIPSVEYTGSNDDSNKQNVTDLNDLVFNEAKEDDTNIENVLNLSSNDFSLVKKFSCRLCSKQYDKIGSLNAHRHFTHKEGKNTCYICGELVNGKKFMNKHFKEKHNKSIFACWDCDTFLPTAAALKHHKENEHGTIYKIIENKCTICDLSFDSLKEYITHKKGHREKSFICKVCSKGFMNSFLLKNHETTHSDKREYACDKCGKSYKTESVLQTHILNVHGENKVPCNICGEVFKSKAYLKNHSRKHQQNYKVQCEVCGLSLTKSAMRTHGNIHLGKRPYKCDSCEKSFSHPSLLKEHKLIHEGIKPFLCSICGNSFRTKATYYKHKLVHTGERRHECTICKKRFPLPHHLKLHMKTH